VNWVELLHGLAPKCPALKRPPNKFGGSLRNAAARRDKCKGRLRWEDSRRRVSRKQWDAEKQNGRSRVWDRPSKLRSSEFYLPSSASV